MEVSVIWMVIAVGLMLVSIFLATWLGIVYKNKGLLEVRPEERPEERLHVYDAAETQYDVVWLQPIFLPAQEYLKDHLKVIESLRDYALYQDATHPNVTINCQLTIRVHFMGWALNNELWQQYLDRWHELQQELKDSRCIRWEQPEPLRMDHNYGQAYIYAKLMENMKDPYDFVIVNASDIYLHQFKEPTLHLGVMTADCLGSGMCAYNELDFNVHDYSIDTPHLYVRHKVRGSETGRDIQSVTVCSVTGGVAGSLAIISREAMEKTGGYKVRGVFSPEDAWIMDSMNEMGFTSYLLESLYINHPYDPVQVNDGFKQWKTRSLENAKKLMESKRDHMTEAELIPWAIESETIFQRMYEERSKEESPIETPIETHQEV